MSRYMHAGRNSMTAGEPGFEALMQGLRRKYQAHLRERCPVIADFQERCHDGTASAADRETMRSHAHSLAGSGMTYGFAPVSDAGRALEDAIEAGAAPAGLAE